MLRGNDFEHTVVDLSKGSESDFEALSKTASKTDHPKNKGKGA